MSVEDGCWAAGWPDQKCCCPGRWRRSTCTMYRHHSSDTSLSTLSCFQICMVALLLVVYLWKCITIPLKATGFLRWAWASKTKSCCKNIKNFVMLVKIKGLSVCYALCALCVPKANGNLSFPKGYNRMGRQLVLLVKHEQAALWQDCHQQPAWVRETRLTPMKMRI